MHTRPGWRDGQPTACLPVADAAQTYGGDLASGLQFDPEHPNMVEAWLGGGGSAHADELRLTALVPAGRVRV